MAIGTVAIGVCSGRAGDEFPELKSFLDRLGSTVGQIAGGDPHPLRGRRRSDACGDSGRFAEDGSMIGFPREDYTGLRRRSRRPADSETHVKRGERLTALQVGLGSDVG